MPAYMIFLREGPVRDEAEMAEYQRKNRAAPPDPNLTPLVAYGVLEAMEGEAPDGVILLRFPTAADAKAWYESPAYQDAMQHRLKAATYRAMIVEGL